MKYLRNYENKAEYNADNTRPTDSSVVSNIKTGEIIYEGKNIFVPKESANVGDILVIDNGELRYIKLDTYDASLITVEPIGVVYYRTDTEIRVIYKDSLGTAQWAAPYEDWQTRLTGFLTAYLNWTRENGYSYAHAGANFENFLQYYSASGSSATGVDESVYQAIRESVFNATDNPLLVAKYGTYENYILDNMVKVPYSNDAIADNDGKANTAKLSLTYIDDDGVEKPCFPAAHAAKNVSAGNVTWWLPSAEEMAVLAHGVKLNYSDPLSRSLFAIGARFGITSNHWTSSERGSSTSWIYSGYISGMLSDIKGNSYVVRAVSAFYF